MSAPAPNPLRTAPGSTRPIVIRPPDFATRALNADGGIFARAGAIGVGLGLIAAVAPRLLAVAQQSEAEGLRRDLNTHVREARRSAARRVAPAAPPAPAPPPWRRRLAVIAARSTLPLGRR